MARINFFILEGLRVKEATSQMISRLSQAALAFVLLSFPLSALDHPVNQIQIQYPASIVVAPGGLTALEISVTVPKNYHIYLNHATLAGNAILSQFSIPPESGFQLREIKRPIGVKEGDELVLRGNGTFSVMIMDLAKFKTDSHSVPLRLRVQICQDNPSICYMPTTLEKSLKVRVAGTPFNARTSQNTKIKWATSYAQAQTLAKSKSLNIFALISNPNTCSACAYLDSDVLSKSDVADFLNSKFVPYNVPSSEYGKFVTESPFGIPTYYAVSATGSKLKTFSGAPDAVSFVSGLKQFAAEPTATTTTTTTPTTSQTNQIDLTNGSRKCKMELKKSYAYRATQNGEFQNTGNVRIVSNVSIPGTYTMLHLGRTAEIESSYNATLKNGKFVVQRYLGKDDLSMTCSDEGVSGEIKAAGLEMNILVRN